MRTPKLAMPTDAALAAQRRAARRLAWLLGLAALLLYVGGFFITR